MFFDADAETAYYVVQGRNIACEENCNSLEGNTIMSF